MTWWPVSSTGSSAANSDRPRKASRRRHCRRGVAAVVDLIVVGVVIGLLYLGLLLSRLIFNPTAFQLPAVDVLFSTAAVLFISTV